MPTSIEWAGIEYPADDVRFKGTLLADLALVRTLCNPEPDGGYLPEAWSALRRLVESHVPALQVAWHTANDRRYDAEHTAEEARRTHEGMCEQLDNAYAALAESVSFWIAQPEDIIENAPGPDSDRALGIMNTLGARPCYLCKRYVLTREEGWWNDKGQAWCHAHQPIWSRP